MVSGPPCLLLCSSLHCEGWVYENEASLLLGFCCLSRQAVHGGVCGPAVAGAEALAFHPWLPKCQSSYHALI